jgi:hypothetical protein
MIGDEVGKEKKRKEKKRKEKKRKEKKMWGPQVGGWDEGEI